MRYLMVGAVAVSLSMLLIRGAVPAPAAAPQPKKAIGHCSAAEEPLFNCAIGTRTVSVCGGGAGSSAYAQYRYGKPGKVELSSPRQGPGSLIFARTGYSGGGEEQFSFANGDFHYVAYSRTIRTGFDAGGNRPDFEDGLFITRAGKLVADKRCTGRLTISGGAEKYLHEGEIIYPE
ncbi:hypothetical protein [Sphingomonas sp. 28-63-12]|uniref:hypothetical protein n=1 Tax=Sphingomonas sp. 28-63-12 TaxID=1970434 RepID=UPI000BCD96E7|nr:MAG: hypothetical protein B7Y47_06505 [Sphingomonas sp. 28-63-12]